MQNIQIAQQKYTSEFYEAINSNCRAFHKVQLVEIFKKRCPQFFFLFKKCSKVAPKKEKNCYSLFIWFDSKMYKLHNKSKISKHFFVLVLFFCASSVTK